MRVDYLTTVNSIEIDTNEKQQMSENLLQQIQLQYDYSNVVGTEIKIAQGLTLY